MIDCNNCKYISVTERVQSIRKEPHMCKKYNIQVFHQVQHNVHTSYLHPCNKCIEQNGFEQAQKELNINDIKKCKHLIIKSVDGVIKSTACPYKSIGPCPEDALKNKNGEEICFIVKNNVEETMLKNTPEYLKMSSDKFSEELCNLNKRDVFELCKRLRFNLNDSHEISKLWKEKSNKLETKLDALKQAFNNILKYTGEED